MTGHPSQDALAEHLADPAAAADVAEHLTGCAQCRARLAALQAASATITALLAAAPAPVMPADVAARITTALQAEHAARTASAAAAETATPQPPTDLAAVRARRGWRGSARRSGRRVPGRLIAASAALVVIAGIAVPIIDHAANPTMPSTTANALHGGPTTQPTSTPGSGGAAGTDKTKPGSGGTALHKATFGADVQALLAAARPTKSAVPGLHGPPNNALVPRQPARCVRAALAGTRFAAQSVGPTQAVTVDAQPAQLVVATDAGGHRTALAIDHCGTTPAILAQARL